MSAAPRTSRIVIAFTAVYLIWGSTYLAIRFAIETLPPMPMAGVRFVIAGLLVMGLGLVRGARWPSARDWKVAMVLGFLYFLGGNGLVVMAERWVASGLAALIIASVTLWIALLDWVRPGGHRPVPQAVVGLIVGFGGVALLIDFSGSADGGGGAFWGALMLVGSAMLWAIGSIYARYTPLPESSLLGSGMQMLCGGFWLSLAGVVLGQWQTLSLPAVSWRSWLAFAYLFIFGSLIAFSAYAWLVKAVRPAVLATYAYANPIVAVILGWLFADEPVTARTLTAMFIIVASVILISTSPSPGIQEH